MKSIFFLVLFFLVSSCAFHTGTISGNESSLEKNIKFVDIAIGNAHAKYLLGIGGIHTDALVMEAKRNMYLKTKLNPGQSYHNITIDFKRSYFFIYAKNEVIITADVIEKQDSTVTNLYSENYLSKLSSNKLLTYNYLALNEKVLLYKGGDSEEAEVIELKRTGVILGNTNSQGKYKLRDREYGDVFKIVNAEEISKAKGFKIDEPVKFYTSKNTNHVPVPVEGIIKGLNYEGAMVEEENGKKYNIPYSKLIKRKV